jgi:hypothetical protein
MTGMKITSCQHIGPDQDPLRDWPVKYCGAPVLEGKSYCHEHYWVVYQKGSAVAGRRREKAVEAEIAALAEQQKAELEESYD